MYYTSSESKGTDQRRDYREADLRLCFRICRLLDCWFSHETAQFCFPFWFWLHLFLAIVSLIQSHFKLVLMTLETDND